MCQCPVCVADCGPQGKKVMKWEQRQHQKDATAIKPSGGGSVLFEQTQTYKRLNRPPTFSLNTSPSIERGNETTHAPSPLPAQNSIQLASTQKSSSSTPPKYCSLWRICEEHIHLCTSYSHKISKSSSTPPKYCSTWRICEEHIHRSKA